MTINRGKMSKQIETGGSKMMKKKGYRNGGMMMMKKKGMKKGGKVGMTVAQLRTAAKKKGYKLVKA